MKTLNKLSINLVTLVSKLVKKPGSGAGIDRS